MVDLNARVTASEAARYLGVTRQLVNSWRTRGKIHKGQDGKYRLRDILIVDRAVRRSGHSHRQPTPQLAEATACG